MNLKMHDALRRDENGAAPKTEQHEDRRLKLVDQWTPPGDRPPPAPRGGVLPCHACSWLDGGQRHATLELRKRWRPLDPETNRGSSAPL